MKIAIAGTRGIPARYGGFETFAEELAKRLVNLGHEVTVYARCKPGETVEPFACLGARVLTLPAVSHKYLETIHHTAVSLLDARRRDFDIVLLCNAANSPLLPLLWGSKIPVAVNVDGIERHRSKWNILGKLWYRLGELASVLFADTIVADADVIADYYLQTYKARSEVISYGAEPRLLPAGATLQHFQLQARKYLLYVTRFEPENNPLGVVEAYRLLSERRRDVPPLVLVGDAPYADEYKKKIYEAAKGLPVIFTGYQFGDAYAELRSNALIGIQATEVGGTHPALLEAMAYGNAVVANDVPEHAEVLGEGGLLYEKNNFSDLADKVELLLDNADLRLQVIRDAQTRIRERYNWDGITAKYLDLFRRMGAE